MSQSCWHRGHDSKGGERIGSGTAIQIGRRVVLATVAHTIPRNSADIILVKKAALITPEKLSCVVRRIASDDDEIDVAIFELADDALERVGLESITLDRVHDGFAGKEHKGWVIGYPETYVVPANGISHGFHGLAYGCEPINPSRWIGIPTGLNLNPNSFVVFEYNPDVIDHSKPLPVPPGLPGPKGLSGGGVWQRPSPARDGELWFPEELCLFAIQSGAMKSGFLWGIQIVHWLKLVAGTYPELRTELLDRFPRIATLT